VTIQEQIQKLKDEITKAEAEANRTAEEAAADPGDPTKAAAATSAAAKLADARIDLKAVEEGIRATAAVKAFVPTEDTTPYIVGNKFKLALLGVYMLVTIGLSVYLLGATMLAETDLNTVKKRIETNGNCNTAATPEPTVTASSANSSAAPSPTPSPSPSPSETVGANASPAASPTGSPSNASNANQPPAKPTASPDQKNIPDVNIPAEVYMCSPSIVKGAWTADGYVFLVVFLSGVLGGSVRAIYSFVRHLGLRNFSPFWTWFYISLPFSGGGLAVAIYFVIRGGFYGGSFGKGLVLNLFSFAALGALTGLFTDNAMEKLKSVAETLLAAAPPKVENAREIQEIKEAGSKK